METAIKKAIEGGWKGFHTSPIKISDEGSWTMVSGKHNGVTKMLPLSLILFDPLFWQALGKAEGWEATQKICGCGCGGNNCSLGYCDENCARYNLPIKSWKSEWHNFIDYLAQGKDINSFFDELIRINY